MTCVYSIANPDTFGAEIEKKCQSIFPLQNVFIRKVCRYAFYMYDLGA